MADIHTQPVTETLTVRLARDSAEIEAAQALRYQVFYEEYAAKATPDMVRLRRDFDEYDANADHLVVVEQRGDSDKTRIVGTYRLLNRAVAEKHGRFYTSGEYNIASILNSGATVLELGRSCILPQYRTRSVLQMLWQGIADYVLTNDIEMLFGCASFHGTDPQALARPLSYLYHYHLAPPDLRPVALPERRVSMNMIPKADLNAREIIGALPPLIKGYLRIGCLIGDGAVVDEQFGTTDVCIMLHTNIIADHYRRHYERKGNKSFSAPAFMTEETPSYAVEKQKSTA